MATVAALLGIDESRTLWAVWGTTQLHIGGYRSVRSEEWLVTFRSSSSDNPWTSLVNYPCLCLISPISQHIMLPQSTVATALIFNWVPATADHNTEPPVYRSLDHMYRSRFIIDFEFAISIMSTPNKWIVYDPSCIFFGLGKIFLYLNHLLHILHKIILSDRYHF